MIEMARQLDRDELSHLGRQGNSDRWDNFSSYKHFGSPNRGNSQRSDCHQIHRKGIKIEICIKEVKINLQNPLRWKEGHLHI